MVNDRELDPVFQALSSGTRRDLLRRLAGGPLTVSQLARPLAISVVAVSKHLHVLENAGLLRRTVAGRRHLCAVEPSGLESADRWLGSALGRTQGVALPPPRRSPVSWTVPHVERDEAGRSTIGDLVIRSA
jgi:DNA-binding transcriptional ArsR family regulator